MLLPSSNCGVELKIGIIRHRNSLQEMHPWICRLPSLKSSHHLHKFQIFGPVSLVFFSTSTPKISIFDCLVNHHHFSPECASNVSSSKFLTKPQNVDCNLNFLKETGFAQNQREALVQKSPTLLSANVERSLKP